MKIDDRKPPVISEYLLEQAQNTELQRKHWNISFKVLTVCAVIIGYLLAHLMGLV